MMRQDRVARPCRYSDESDSRRLLDFDSEDEIMTDRSRSRSGTPIGDRTKGKKTLQRKGKMNFMEKLIFPCISSYMFLVNLL